MCFTGIAVRSLMGLLVFAVWVLAAVEQLTLEQLTQQANTIFIGRVIEQISRWDYEKNIIVTDVSIGVEGFLKNGSAKNYVTLTIPGGVVGELGLTVSGVPVFVPDEIVVLFLRVSSTAEFQLVNLQQGKASIQGGLVLREGESPVRLLDFVRQVREAMGERGPLPAELSDLVSRHTPPGRAVEHQTVPAPVISRITPNAGPAHADKLGSTGCAADSTRITIDGANFGASQYTSAVRFWSKSAAYNNGCVESWSDTRIIAKVPGGASSGNVTVVVDGASSNGATFMVTYSYGGGKWTAGTFPQPMPSLFFINPANSDGLVTSSVLDAVLAAASVWNMSGASFQFRYGGTSTKTASGHDYENSVLLVNSDIGGVAATYLWYYTSQPNVIIESDIVFDDLSYVWGTGGSDGKMDIQNVATHEFGHWLRLVDLYGSADREKTMYGFVSAGEIKKFSLEAEDIAGIRYIYPKENPTAQVTYAQIVLGGGYETVLIVSNKTTLPWQGRVRLRRGNNQSWIWVWSCNGKSFTGFSDGIFDLGPRGSAKLVFRGDAVVRSGYLGVSARESSYSSDVALSCFYHYYVDGKLTNTTGSPPSKVAGRFVFPVEISSAVDTAYAVAPGPDFSPSQIKLRLFDRLGVEIGSKLIDCQGHFAEFVSQRFPGLPADFIGNILIESPVAVALTVLRMDFGAGWFLLTSVPPDDNVP